LSQSLFLRSVGQKAEVTDAHEAVRQDVEEEAADKLLSVQSHRLFSIPVFSISIAQGDFSVFDLENTVIGERDAVSVAAEVNQAQSEANRTVFWRRPPSSFGVMI